MAKSGRTAFTLATALAAALFATACNLVDAPLADVFDDRAQDGGDSSSPAETERTLANAEWVIAPQSTGAEQSTTEQYLHWRHSGLEAVLSRDDARARLRRAMRSLNAAVSATAAIGLARLGDTSALARLETAVLDMSLKLSTRGAAVEAIGMLDTPQADGVLAKLNGEYGQFRGAARSRYLPELHDDLVRAMARREGDRHAATIDSALESPAAPVRLEATRAYMVLRRSPQGGRGSRRAMLPRELIDRTSDDVAAVRAAAILALATNEHPLALDVAERGVSDYDLTVRLAAIKALGVLPDRESAARLHELAENTSEVIRSAAVIALASRGDLQAVARAAEDKSWRVRSAAAEELLRVPYAQREPLAQSLIVDRSVEVQKTMLHALARWSLEEAIPLLLMAIEQGASTTRRAAVEQLQDRWPPAAELSAQASRQSLIAEAARLREIWQRESGAEVSRRLESAREMHIEPNTASPQAAVAAIERLASASLDDRRAAARQLARDHAQTLLPDEALSQLRELVEDEKDTLIWNDLLVFLDRDPRAAAGDLAAIAATHPTGEVRRRACAYFGHHSSPRAVSVLLNSLTDEDVTVVREAIRSLGHQREISDLSSLRALLTSTDSTLRLESAATLARLGSQDGLKALRRLTDHQDSAIRRAAEARLKSIGDDSPPGP